jgi:hypothetical protein
LPDIFYSKFVDRIKESFAEGKPIDWQEIIKTRYLDWAITDAADVDGVDKCDCPS